MPTNPSVPGFGANASHALSRAILGAHSRAREVARDMVLKGGVKPEERLKNA